MKAGLTVPSRGGRTADQPGLGPLEIAVLKFLWESARSLSVAEVHGGVITGGRTSHNTVGSALQGLHQKGMVARTKVSHAFAIGLPLSGDRPYWIPTRLHVAPGVCAPPCCRSGRSSPCIVPRAACCRDAECVRRVCAGAAPVGGRGRGPETQGRVTGGRQL